MTEGVFGEMLYALLRWYYDPFLVPGVKGGYGRAMLNKLIELGYDQTLIFNRHLMSELQAYLTNQLVFLLDKPSPHGFTLAVIS